MSECPHCQRTEHQVKNGMTKFGSQRYKCKVCQRIYTPDPKQQGYPDVIRQKAIQLYVDGMSLRAIGRHLGVDHKSVGHWAKAHAAKLPDAPVPNDVNNAELDELYTFVGSKKQNLPDDGGRS
jgi:transposase-like protein